MKFDMMEEKRDRYDAKIKVVGVGGAGGNAINNMIDAHVQGVDFIVANTDSQDLERSACPCRIQLGPAITKGLGAGADAAVGKSSAEESITEIRESIGAPDMVFITAGMGGGTGTGASPVIARECKESGALTVAVVTKPFKFEGDKRMKNALAGIEKLKSEVDSLIVIPNDRLMSIAGKSMSFRDLISKADEVLLQAVRGISDLIVSSGFINLDFADVRKVMEQNGAALMGMGRAEGERRASEAAQMAINSPLLEDISISGAKGLLMNITGPTDITMEEIDDACNYIKEEVNSEAEIFWGMVFNDDLEGEVQVTVIATGIEESENASAGRSAVLKNNVVQLRDVSPEEAQEGWTVKVNGSPLDSLDTPTFVRGGQEIDPDGKKQGKEGKKRLLGRYFRENLDIPTFLRAKAD